MSNSIFLSLLSCYHLFLCPSRMNLSSILQLEKLVLFLKNKCVYVLMYQVDKEDVWVLRLVWFRDHLTSMTWILLTFSFCLLGRHTLQAGDKLAIAISGIIFLQYIVQKGREGCLLLALVRWTLFSFEKTIENLLYVSLSCIESFVLSDHANAMNWWTHHHV